MVVVLVGGGRQNLDGRGLGIEGILEQLLDHRRHRREHLHQGPAPSQHTYSVCTVIFITVQPRHPKLSRWRVEESRSFRGHGGSATNLHRGDPPAVRLSCWILGIVAGPDMFRGLACGVLL